MILDNLKRLLATPTEEFGRFTRFWVFQVKLWWHCGRQLGINRANQQAAALSYHTIFGIVPLVIVTLLIFQAIPTSGDISARLMGMVFEQLHLSAIEIPGEGGTNVKLTEHLETIFKTFFTGEHRGAITIISVLFIIWAAIGLLGIIERTFNTICNVTKGRNLIQRVRDYWAILTLGPLLMAAAIYVSTQFAAVEHVKHMVAPAVLNYLFSVAGFFVLYLIMPNTRLSLKAILWGSVVAALAWTIIKSGFGYYVSNFKPYATVYGAMGLIPLSVLWIYVTWLIVLFGLELTYTTQHLKSLEDAELAAARKNDAYFLGGDVSAMNIMALAASAFAKKSGPVTFENICSTLGMPAELADKMLGQLVLSGLLIRTAEPVVGYMPATDPAGIKLSDIASAVDEAGVSQNTGIGGQAARKIRADAVETLSSRTLAELLDDWK